MDRIVFVPDPSGAGTLKLAPAFPREYFAVNMPEALGDAASPTYCSQVEATWSEGRDGAWTLSGKAPGELSYSVSIEPHEDTVDVRVRLRNESDRRWAHSLAFNCFNCGPSPLFRDFECGRHWGRRDDQFVRIADLPRTLGQRPSVQFFDLEGARPPDSVRHMAYVEEFGATSESRLEPWLAIRSRDGEHVAAVASRPALFLFQNLEYSCIHCSPALGALAPGESSGALTRVYLVRATLPAWYERMRAELG